MHRDGQDESLFAIPHSPFPAYSSSTTTLRLV